MDEPLVVRREVQIAAPPSTVFAFLTDPEKILRWMGTEATVEPQPGGLYLVNVTARMSPAAGSRRSSPSTASPIASAGTTARTCRRGPA
jgi:Uncharacterized conserved protein